MACGKKKNGSLVDLEGDRPGEVTDCAEAERGGRDASPDQQTYSRAVQKNAFSRTTLDHKTNDDGLVDPAEALRGRKRRDNWAPEARP
jgi:hypothetical protein